MPVLSDRDSNTKLSSSVDKSEAGDKMGEKGAQEGKQFMPRLGGNSKSDTYISPSDAIVSPASKKLAAFKQRQINKQNSKNPAVRTLFARSVSACSSTSGPECGEEMEKE